ncbi:MAG: DUF4834 family protein [Roseivirga sp.]|nr:DUF4834 family protein [Roseivirga sp.]
MIFFLGLWLVKSILRGVLSSLFGSVQQRSFNQQRPTGGQQTRSGNVNVNQPPRQSRKDKTSDDYKGGDYIEYEEVD